MDRRSFLQQSTLASASLFMPRFLQGLPSLGSQNRILIVIQLSGGNDGLNTIIPYRNDLYYENRPGLAIPKDELLPVHDELGLHPSLSPLRELYDQGWLSVVNSVGYPNPDRSHFRSMDIWHTASASDTYLHTGWLGRYLDNHCPGSAPHTAIEVDDSLSLALKGERQSGLAVSDPQKMYKAVHQPFFEAIAKEKPAGDTQAFLYKTLTDTQSSTEYLVGLTKDQRTTGEYPATPFGKDLRQIAELIAHGASTRIYYASLGSFDTHANQARQQARLLEQYAQGIKALVQDLRHHGVFQETLILTFSEFGRRVKQNASGGTDHGAANNLFLIGDRFPKAGFYNAPPDLQQLDQGDLMYQVDFRNIYATVLEKWMDAESFPILGSRFEIMGNLLP
ncbi:MAG: DUF1501 domain-containing protein [Saprospiraceae bacterium]